MKRRQEMEKIINKSYIIFTLYLLILINTVSSFPVFMILVYVGLIIVVHINWPKLDDGDDIDMWQDIKVDVDGTEYYTCEPIYKREIHKREDGRSFADCTDHIDAYKCNRCGTFNWYDQFITNNTNTDKDKSLYQCLFCKQMLYVDKFNN